MHLYRRFNSTIDVYKLIPNERNIRIFKEDEMKKIPEDEIILTCNNGIKNQPIDSKNNVLLQNYLKATYPFGDVIAKKDIDGNTTYMLKPINITDTLINIPVSLYDLENILQRRLKYIDGISDEELLMLSQLFKLIGPISSFDTAALERFYEFGLIPDIFDELDEKVERSDRVFNLIRKR